jgi:hypothetical protein
VFVGVSGSQPAPRMRRDWARSGGVWAAEGGCCPNDRRAIPNAWTLWTPFDAAAGLYEGVDLVPVTRRLVLSARRS